MVTAVKAADHISLSPSRFRDLVAAGVFERQPPGKYDLDVIRPAYCLHMQKVAAGRGSDHGAALSTQRARLATAQSERAELANLVSRGHYVSLLAVKEVLEGHFVIIRERLLTMEGKISDGLTPYTPKDRAAIMEILHAETYEALNDLSNEDFMRAASVEAAALAKPDADIKVEVGELS
jgi:hypothetical protein